MSAESGKERNWTTLSIHRSTHERVKTLKREGETFDSLLERMADCTENDDNV